MNCPYSTIYADSILSNAFLEQLFLSTKLGILSTFTPFLMGGHATQLSMSRVLVLENQLVKQAVHIWVKQTGVPGCRTHVFRITGGNGTGHQLLYLS